MLGYTKLNRLDWMQKISELLMRRANSYERDKRSRVSPHEFGHRTVDLWAWIFDLNIIFILKENILTVLNFLKIQAHFFFLEFDAKKAKTYE